MVRFLQKGRNFKFCWVRFTFDHNGRDCMTEAKTSATPTADCAVNFIYYSGCSSSVTATSSSCVTGWKTVGDKTTQTSKRCKNVHGRYRSIYRVLLSVATKIIFNVLFQRRSRLSNVKGKRLASTGIKNKHIWEILMFCWPCVSV